MIAYCDIEHNQIEKDILVLNIVTQFHKVVIKITGLLLETGHHQKG